MIDSSNTTVPCVCVHRCGRFCGGVGSQEDKTAVRRGVCDETHNEQRFLSLLHSLSSSSRSKRLVILHTHSGWLYYEQLDNDRGGVAA